MKESETLNAWLHKLKEESRRFKGIGRFDPRVLEQEGLNRDQVYKNWEQDCLSKLQNLDSFRGEEYKIPPIEHMVYFTSNTEAKELRQEYVEKVIATANRLSTEDPNFQPILWTNNLNISDLRTIQEIKRQVPNLQIRSVEEFSEHPLYPHLSELIQKGQDDYRYFVEASDIARILSIEKYGGIYHDLDYEIFNAKAIVIYMKSFDYFNGREEHNRWDSFTGNAFIAAKPHHPVPMKATLLMKRNLDKGPDAPEYIHFPLNKFDSVICTTGPAMLNIAYSLEGNQAGNIDMVFPGNVLYNADFARDESSDKLSRGFPKTEWKGINVQTVGGDLFQGKWGDGYLEDIPYFKLDSQKSELFEVLTAMQKDDYTLFDTYVSKTFDREILREILYILIKKQEIEKINQLLQKN